MERSERIPTATATASTAVENLMPKEGFEKRVEEKRGRAFGNRVINKSVNGVSGLMSVVTRYLEMPASRSTPYPRISPPPNRFPEYLP
ncbi:hypothetical protein HZH68_005532 [Vespula germanica]|uniref:Uncharacterized protein n=5 Tax=Vespula TaxID=7451 RepID=A0A834KGD4_VESGE|nr:hypothetical protein HZH66_005052 [Vespula vulgaris]KAF7406163.1 hypothetical protein HZH68_005532 [Vespula germanica]KAF7429674.1 hypothetical protein H0235_006072 [Vespula pensylvanica]